MSHSSDPLLLALHGLRLKGFAEAAVVGNLYGKTETETSAQLTKAAQSELATHREGRMSGWSLTPAGRTAEEQLLSDELDAAGARQLVQSAYDRFLALNGSMLEVCTRWQVKDLDAQELNDHSDPAYDAGVIAELAALDDGVQPILTELVAVLDRFNIYPERFSFALDKLRGGDNEWFTKPIMESYHTVWFEMHEDLLATLGIDRASEGAH